MNFNEQDICVEHYIGLIDKFCIHCNARHFVTEKNGNNNGWSLYDCCSHGTVVREALPEFPHELREFFEATHQNLNDFFNRIHCYNNSLSFASFNANLINFNEKRPGPYCFKIQGQMYCRVNTALYPELSKAPNYGQLFIVDSNEATEHHLNRDSQ